MASGSINPVETSADAVSSASAQMIERARKSVVQVRSRGRGAGAGVIWDADGLALTNHHVVARGRRGRKIQAVLHDGRTFDAEVVKRNQSLDLALLRIKTTPATCRWHPSGTPPSCASASWSSLSATRGAGSGR